MSNNKSSKQSQDTANVIKPGTDNQDPGTYVEVGPRGGKVENARTVTIEKGERLPATSKSGNGWVKQN
ncbi:MAG: YjzC family protein [Oscillospiraceae bacterium]|nr:YjzC family protein [Oscillospiraceae bacterium]